MDIPLLITTIVLAGLIILSSVYFLVYFQHPDDKWVAWLPKFVVVAGVTLCCYNILLLPLDVANHAGSYLEVGGLPMAQIAGYLYLLTVLMGIIAIPFTMFYYEGGDEKDDYEGPSTSKQFFYAAKWTFATVVLFFGAILLMWWYIGFAEVEYDQISIGFTYQGTDPYAGSPDINYCATAGSCVYKEDLKQQIPVSAIMYIIALASLFGWVLFAMFGGVGIPSLPMDLLVEFKHRPKRIKLQEYAEKKKLIGEQAELLLNASQAFDKQRKEVLKSSSSRKAKKLKNTENEFKRDVMYLESQWKRLEDAYKNGGGNPLVHYFKFLVGFVGFFVSLLWFIHIMVYVLPMMIPPDYIAIDPFLNNLFSATFGAPIVGMVFYGVFVFWLMLCVIKGTIKLGVRFLLISIHPMKMGETMMSSFVFNVGLMLFSSLAVSQFCAISFSSYAIYTSSLSLFGNSLTQLLYIKYIYMALVFILPIMIFLTTIYVTFKPYDYKTKPII